MSFLDILLHICCIRKYYFRINFSVSLSVCPLHVPHCYSGHIHHLIILNYFSNELISATVGPFSGFLAQLIRWHLSKIRQESHLVPT